MAVYISNPDSIVVNDVGTTVSINVFTADACFYKETNVQGSGPGQGQTQQQDIENQGGTPNVAVSNGNIHAWYDGIGNQVAMVLTNSGTATAQITGVDVNGDSSGNMYDCVGSFTVSSSLTWISGGGLGLIETQIQGHSLTQVTDCDIPAGQTAILYLIPETGLGNNGDIVGSTITIGIAIQGISTLAEQVTVQNYE
jgi:hypothetical protein